MSHNDLQRLILAHPQIALHILENNGRRLSEAESRLEDMAFKGVTARIANLLLRLADDQGPGVAVIEGYTHADLADSVATYRETATQILNDLMAAGVIEIGRKRISIVDREGLALLGRE
jgi:CRP-like cAMP-binding protein